MSNFSLEMYRQRQTQAPAVHRVKAEVPTVQERVTVTPPAPAPQEVPAAEFPEDPKNLVDPRGSYEWEKVRDYAVAMIEKIHGPFPRNTKRENTVFMGFAARWEGIALDIAAYAFETAGGEWLGAPVGVARFDKASDPVFAARIADLI